MPLPVVHDHVVAVLLGSLVVLDVEGHPLLELVGGDQLANVLDDEITLLEILLHEQAEALARGPLNFQD